MAYRKRRFKWQGARRAFSRGGFRAAYRGGGGSILFGAGGVVAGAMAPEILPYQTPIMTLLAVLPGVLPMGKTLPWQLRRFASGYVVGRMAKAYIGIPGIAGATGDFA